MAKRGKTPREPGGDDMWGLEPPSKLLSSILSTLDMTFEGDTGMLNGDHVRSVPGRETLSELQVLLDKLRVSLDSIAKGDQEVIGRIEKAKLAAAAAVVENKEDEKESSEIPPGQGRKRPPLMENENEEKEEAEAEEEESKPSSSAQAETKRPRLDVEKIENDPSVKNPKSEFVVSQTLPRAAASLGLFNEEGLESTGEDFLKRKYQVASYPTNDLSEYLPGELPEQNFSYPKPTNQIQYTTFLASVENFFREFNDDDLKFLKSKCIIPITLDVNKAYDPEVSPYVIPKLGPLYSDVWLKGDGNQNIANTSPPPVSEPSSFLPRKSAAEINDTILDTEEVSCGPLVSRLLSAILKDEADVEDESKIVVKEEGSQSVASRDGMDSREETPLSLAHTPPSDVDDKPPRGSTTSTLPNPLLWKVNSINLDYPTFEERLKRELRYVGIYMNMPRDEGGGGDDPDWLTGREDDEISAEIRELQTSLKNVTARNQKRKAALVPLVERQLAWQEYSSILDDLDKQIDQAYIKRIRVPKKRKKNHSGGTSGSVNQGTASQVAQQKAANSSLKALLDKRQRWIKKIGPLFDRPEIMKRMPKESVFKDLDQEEEEEETDVFGQNGNGKEDELTEA